MYETLSSTYYLTLHLVVQPILTILRLKKKKKVIPLYLANPSPPSGKPSLKLCLSSRPLSLPDSFTRISITYQLKLVVNYTVNVSVKMYYQQLHQCCAQPNEKVVFWFAKWYLQHLFQVNKYLKPPLDLILGSETLSSVLFFQVESLITILSQPYPHSHCSSPTGSVKYISQIHTQSKDFGPLCLCLLFQRR